MMAKKKSLKVSRNRKKVWKKHCEAEDVEEFLENNRFNERIGYVLNQHAHYSIITNRHSIN